MIDIVDLFGCAFALAGAVLLMFRVVAETKTQTIHPKKLDWNVMKRVITLISLSAITLALPVSSIAAE